MKISVVSYLNSKPFLFGLHEKSSPDWNISLDIPSDCARKLISGEADLGLVPVAALKAIPDYKIVSPYCISADGPVDSVKLYSQVPVQQVKKVVLDYQSRTSVALAQILARELWKITPEFVAGKEGYETEIDGDTAVVVIGDRTFAMNGKYIHEYDLSVGWKELTKLPFVFAVWASKTALATSDEMKITAALAHGLANISTVVDQNQPKYPGTDVRKYLTQSISYHLSPEKRKAIELFLNKLA